MFFAAALRFGFASHDVQEVTRRNNPGVAPSRRKVFEIAGHQVGRPGSLSTLQEDVVIRIGTHPDGFRRSDPEALFTNDVKGRGDYI
jgi:hypothetical protein